ESRVGDGEFRGDILGRPEISSGVAGAGGVIVDARGADRRMGQGPFHAGRDGRVGFQQQPLSRLGEPGWGRSLVVCIDEIGQISTHQLLALLRAQSRYGFQIVALGDPKQCQAVEAGAVIDLLERALPGTVPQMLTTIRQLTERERQISHLFREGAADEALAMKRQDGTAQLVPGPYDEVVQHVAALWAARTQANAADPDYRLTVFAPSNADARAISSAIREVRRARGEIGPDVTTLDAIDQYGQRYDMPVAIGDRIRLFSRLHASLEGGGHGHFGTNGAVVEVLAVDDAGMKLRDARGKIGIVSWAALRDRQHGTQRYSMAAGDVLTIDAGQGLTSTEHIDAMAAGTRNVTGFKAYVSESRHRRTSYMVVGESAERAEVVN